MARSITKSYPSTRIYFVFGCVIARAPFPKLDCAAGYQAFGRLVRSRISLNNYGSLANETEPPRLRAM